MQLRTADTKRRHTKAQNTFPSPFNKKNSSNTSYTKKHSKDKYLTNFCQSWKKSSVRVVLEFLNRAMKKITEQQ